METQQLATTCRCSPWLPWYASNYHSLQLQRLTPGWSSRCELMDMAQSVHYPDIGFWMTDDLVDRQLLRSRPQQDVARNGNLDRRLAERLVDRQRLGT